MEVNLKMNKVAIVTDSNSGMTQSQAKELGVYVLPMPFIAEGEIYYEDINLTTDEFFEKLAAGIDIKTSQPAVEEVTNLWDEVLKTHESIVHIPMSSGLSSSCETAMMLANDYDGRVEVVNNQRISVTQKLSVMDALALAKEGESPARIKEILEECKFESSIYIMLDTLYYLKKGGRITPAASALGTALRLKPVLQIQGEKLDAYAIARTKKQGVTKMLDAVRDDIVKRFGGLEEVDNMHFAIAHTQNEEAALALKQKMLEIYPGHDIIVDPLSLSISCHIGPGALAVTCTKKINI